jgi:fatty acid desaturase
VPRLRHAADRRSLALAAAHFALVGGALAGWIAGYPTWIAIPVIACSSFIQLISTHNAMHAPVFFEKRANRIWQCVLSLGIGYPVSVFVPVHNLSHHLGLQTPRDILRTTEVRHRWNLLNLIHHMVMGTVHLHLLHLAYLGEMRRSRPKWFAQVRWEALAVVAYLGAAAALAGPLAMLAVVWGPCVIGQLLIVGFGYVQHDGCDADSEHHHSRNFLSPIFNWFIFDNGYHTVHHDHPALHWSRGRDAHRDDVVPDLDARLDERSLIAYLWRAFIWPGRRLRFDGAPVVLPAALTRRELWTPASAITSGASSGAVEG